MDKVLQQYSTAEEIRKYRKDTAGDGISYLLENVYGKIYLDVIDQFRLGGSKQGLRLLEYGCGAGMNLIHLVEKLEQRGIPVEIAYGTDFSENLIKAANAEVEKFLSPALRGKVKFFVARNETLIKDMTTNTGLQKADLEGAFDLVFGVNTLRYCFRLKKEKECVHDIYDLLRKGGVSVMIDMNDKFPFFRSRKHDLQTKPKEEHYLPSLDEYASPFPKAGLKILRKENFCWIPHSSSKGLFLLCRAASPVLNLLARSRAMRSLVVAQRPC